MQVLCLQIGDTSDPGFPDMTAPSWNPINNCQVTSFYYFIHLNFYKKSSQAYCQSEPSLNFYKKSSQAHCQPEPNFDGHQFKSLKLRVAGEGETANVDKAVDGTELLET